MKIAITVAVIIGAAIVCFGVALSVAMVRIEAMARSSKDAAELRRWKARALDTEADLELALRQRIPAGCTHHVAVAQCEIDELKCQIKNLEKENAYLRRIADQFIDRRVAELSDKGDMIE